VDADEQDERGSVITVREAGSARTPAAATLAGRQTRHLQH
jgi:hypothetical protein